ncbi:MAG: HAD family phosphatase [Bacteroidia bacterium]|nr:HAD family phosphatase [Bacteroidia bacterium]
MAAINTLIFDLGGVLVDWNVRYLYRKIFDEEERMEWFLKNITPYSWNLEQDKGRSFADGTAELLEKHPEWEAEIKAYYGRYTEQFDGAIDETVSMLKDLVDEGKYRLLALTNWPAESFDWARQSYPFLSWFEGIVVSGVEGVIKPDPEIYQLLFERYHVDPATAIFMDDNVKNVEGGKAVGLQSILVESPAQLRHDLFQALGREV